MNLTGAFAKKARPKGRKVQKRKNFDAFCDAFAAPSCPFINATSPKEIPRFHFPKLVLPPDIAKEREIGMPKSPKALRSKIKPA